ncbi:MAG TPA: ABC transporter substrate-binding protein [Tepidisphaeraceae bacterium]|jgi:NitT/TauT family transport system substrate-binding protein|nr:ABC transporter substrate-binding protein [Tepidisphaeraceae bacterium]
MKIAKNLTRMVVGALVAAGLVGSATFAEAATPVKVAHNLWIGFAPAYVAKEKGIFAKHGLDVEFVAFAGPGDSLPPVLAGHVDFALSCPDNVVLLHGGQSDALVSVYQIDTSAGADGIVAKKEIKTPADLEGKKVAATIGAVNHLLMLMTLEKGGLKESDVEVVNMNADDAGAAFIAGTLDAAATWEPWLTKATEANGHVLFSSNDAPGVLGDCIVATRKTTTDRPEVVTAFIAAMDEGVAYLAANETEGLDVAAKYLDIKPAEAKDMLSGVKLFTIADNKRLFGTPDAPGPQYAVMQKLADFMVAHDVIQGKPEVSKMIEPKFVMEAK